ncbi:MAG: putative motility protein [Wolinella sp.]
MDLMGIGAGLANSSGPVAIPVLKKAMETQENLAMQILEGTLGALSQPSPSSHAPIQEAAVATGRGTSLDVRA